MSYVIVVSSSYASVTHGLWARRDVARATAERWNRAYKNKGWPLSASVVPLLGKTAATRDKIGARLADMAERSRHDEMAAVGADPCPCEALDMDPESVTDDQPEGICACGHVPDEHEETGDCLGLVIVNASN